MIIETKLYVPKTRTALVSRPRLSQRLDEGLTRKLTLVTAPAGYGKTTMATEWATALQSPVAWVSLDIGDRDVIRFWRYTIAALKQAVPAIDEQAVLRLATADQSGEALIAALINLLNRLSEMIVLIWDDFHHVAEPILLQGMAYLLEHLPSHVHLYMLSRTLPSLSLARMRTDGLLNQIGMEDLRFSAQETADFFRGNHKPPLLIGEMNEILERTEGWIAGLQLSVLYLNEQASSGGIDQRELGAYGNIADYFFEEVFVHQSQGMQHYLLVTSLLERMNDELCQAVTSLPESNTYLLQLQQMNFFLVALDKERKWYRYHHLFRDFLRVKLKGLPIDQIKTLHRAAGRWLEKHDYIHEAMKHYLAGEYYIDAIRLLEHKAPAMMQLELSTLRKWLGSIPDLLLFDKPMLFMNAILSMLLAGDTGMASKKLAWALYRVDEHAASHTDVISTQFRGGLAMLQIMVAFFEGDFEASVRLSEHYVKTYPDDNFFANLGMAGDAQIPQWDLAETMGSLRKEAHILSNLLTIWSGTNHYFLIADICIGYGQVMYEWNRLEEAEHQWKRARQLGIMHDNAMIVALADVLLTKVCIARGQSAKAAEIISRLKEEIQRRGYSNLSDIIEVHQARFSLRQGDMEQAMIWLGNSDMQSTDEIPSTMLAEYDLLASLLIEQGKTREAAALIKRLIHIAHRTGRMRDRIHLLTRQSLLFNRMEMKAESMDVLEQSLALAEPEGYIRTFIDAGEPLMALLYAYLKARQEQHIRTERSVSLAYVKQLLTLGQLTNDEMGASTATKGAIYSIALTARESVILGLIAAGLSNKEIALECGISYSTVKTHINNLYSKLRVTNRFQAINRAKQLGLP